MPTFAYKIRKNGRTQVGSIEAESLHAASRQLRQDGGILLQIRQETSSSASRSSASAAPGALDGLQRLMISKGQIELSLRQLASLLRAGVPIMTALEAVGTQSSPALGKVYLRIAQKVRLGYSMKRSLQEEAAFFGDVTIGLIDVGEANGTLDEMFLYASNLMERGRKIKSQIVQAFTYPGIVFFVAMGVSYFLVVHVLPKIMEFITKQAKSIEMPLPTRMLMATNDFLWAYGAYLVLIPPIIIAIFFFARKNPEVCEKMDYAMLYIPLLGKAFREHSNAMWSQTLGALIKSGVDVLVALELVEGVLGNKHYASQIRIIRNVVRQGGSLSKGIQATTLARFCPMALSMVSVSEQSGSVDTALLSVADYCEEQLTRRVAILGKLVEPALFAFIGGIVGFIYFAFFLAMLATTHSAAG
ncbi:MAG: type II secretion system F family protein [Planctomycetia bacterium]|nr:type II secretion system F family protein [Planctomycetia bacterium]